MALVVVLTTVKLPSMSDSLDGLTRSTPDLVARISGLEVKRGTSGCRRRNDGVLRPPGLLCDDDEVGGAAAHDRDHEPGHHDEREDRHLSLVLEQDLVGST